MLSVTVEQEPRCLVILDGRHDLTAYLRPALLHAGDRVKAELVSLSSGGVARGWKRQAVVQAAAVELQIVNPHPGARPLDQGARWPGRMPPWGPGTPLAAWAHAHGIPPFLVARKLKRDGLLARHYVDRALAATGSEISTIIAQEGVGRWLAALAGA